MKHLFAIRHAKSSWANGNLADFQRPLNNRGKRDAPQMAKMLHEKIRQVDTLISSHATRAHTTAKLFAEPFGISANDVLVRPRLYHCTEKDILEFVHDLDDTQSRICLFGHNPGMTSFANMFGPPFIDHVPTCGIVHLRSSSDTWNGFSKSNTELVDFYYPKQFQ